MPESNNPTLAGREAPTVEGLHTANQCVDAAVLHLLGTREWPEGWVTLRDHFLSIIREGYRIPGAAEGWIAVSEKLPEGADAISCEAWCKAEGDCQPAGPCVMSYDADLDVDPEDRWNSREDTGCWEPGEVTHWRSRPAPPTGAAEGTKGNKA